MENPPCEIIHQQSQRYSHQSNGGAQRMVQSIRNHIKAYKIQFEKNSGITNQSRQSSAHLVTTTRNMAMHAIPQTTRLYNNINKPFSLKCAQFFVRCLVETASAVDHGGRQRQRHSKAAGAATQTVPSARTSERCCGPVQEEAPHLTKSEEGQGREVGSRRTTRPSSGSTLLPAGALPAVRRRGRARRFSATLSG